MTIAVSKKDVEQLDAAIAVAIAKQSEVEAALSDFNEIVDEAKAPVTDALIALDEANTAIKEIIDAMTSDWRIAFGEKSDKWRESSNGTETEAFIEAWEEFGNEIPSHADELVEFPEPVEFEPRSYDDRSDNEPDID